MDFHIKWGHLNFPACCKELGMDESHVNKLICPECQLSKQIRKKRPKESATRSDQPCYRIHADLSGRKLSSLAGFRYYLLLTDDHSRFRWIKLLKLKSEAAQEIILFIKQIEREKAPLKVAIFRSDGGGEFHNHTLDTFFKDTGIKKEISIPYSQFQNGVSERSIGVIDDSARTMMLYAGSPVFDWCHAVTHSVFLRNRLPSSAIDGRKPIELFTGIQRPLRRDQPVFGCLGYAKVNIRGKQENKGRRVVLLSSGDEFKGDLVRDITSFHSSLSEYNCRNVTYDIRQYPYKSRLVPRPPVPALDSDDIKEQLRIQDMQQKQLDSNDVQVHSAEVKDDGSEGWEVERVIDKRPSRFGPRQAANKGYDYKVVWRPEGLYPDSWQPESHLQECVDAIQAFETRELALPEARHAIHERSPAPARRSARLNATALPACNTLPIDVLASEGSLPASVTAPVHSDSVPSVRNDSPFAALYSDPKTRHQATSSIHCDEWLAAEQDELQSIAQHHVWTLVDRAPGMNVLGCRFVYKLKKHPDGTIDKFKVRLVAQGFGQQEGIDYQEIFATTAAFQAIRMVLWIAVFYNMEFWKLDIKTFFLYGDLLETIYMKQPPGYEVGDKVCKLTKSLYGLKQSMRCALKVLTDQLALQNIMPLMTDQNTFFRKDSRGVVILFAWVDDIGMCSLPVTLAEEVLEKLKSKFEITVDKNPSDYLQIQIRRDSHNRQLKLFQTGYIDSLLQSYQMQDCNPLKVPFTSTNDLPPPKTVVKDEEVPFMQLVGSLLWLLKTRPDIGIYCSILTRYMNRFDKLVFKYALCVLKYLAGTRDFGIVYDESSSPVEVYGKGVTLEFEVDSEFGGRVDDSKSTTGWIVRANNSVVYSGCQVQKRVATSTTEAESNGLELVSKEAQWYRDFCNELHIEVNYAFPVLQDNKGALTLTDDPKNRPRTKYFRISQHFIRSQRMLGNLQFLHRQGTLLACDMLTKPLFFPAFQGHRASLLGNQDVPKKKDAGKEFSSDYTGDGPARTKRVSRFTPLQIRKKRKRAQQKQKSVSSHSPPLYAMCPACQRFLKWKLSRFDWKSCDCFLPFCDQCKRIICVACLECDTKAEREENIDHWYCPRCLHRTSRQKRRRCPTDFYQP